MDRFERIAGYGQFPAVIVGNPSSFDYEVVPIDAEAPWPWHDLTGRDQRFLGTIGILEGAPKAELAERLDGMATQYISALYCAHVAGRQHVAAKSSAQWLEDLYRLEDPRG